MLEPRLLARRQDASGRGPPIPSSHDTGYVRLFDAKTGKVLWEQTKAHAERVHALAFCPDGKTLASGSMDLTVKLWDAATGKLLRTLVGHGEPGVYRVAFSPTARPSPVGAWMAPAGSATWTRESSGIPSEATRKRPCRSSSFSRDGQRLLVADLPDGSEVGAEQKPAIRLIDLQTGNLPRCVPHSTPPTTWAKLTVP